MNKITSGNNWSWHGLAGVILATTVGVGWSVSLVITALSDGPITDSGAQILNTIGGGLIGAVATWIGLAGGKKPSDPDTTNDPQARRAAPSPSDQASLDTPPSASDDGERREEQP